MWPKVKLSKVGHYGLVYLEDDERYRACVIELEGGKHCRALVFLDPWREFPKFGFVYLTADVSIKGRLGSGAIPTTPGMAEVNGRGLGQAQPGAIFRIGAAAVLWVVNDERELTALHLSLASDGAAGFRHYHWWLLGHPLDDGKGVLPAALVESVHPAIQSDEDLPCYYPRS